MSNKMKMTEKLLKKFYLLDKSIEETEKKVYPTDFIMEGSVFVIFDKIRDNLTELYGEFDDINQDFMNMLDYLKNIIENWFTTFEFDKLTKKEKKELTDKNWNLGILKRDQEKYSHCIRKFKNIDEIIKYIVNEYK